MSNTELKQKHIFFLCDDKDSYSLETVKRLKSELNDRRIRVYYSQENDNVNTDIAQGVENAGLVLVFASPFLESSKKGSKILNYADQIKIPVLNVKHFHGFQPKNWLGAILAAAKNVTADVEDILKTVSLLEIIETTITLKENEKNEPHPVETPLFTGGTNLGNMTAYYFQYEKKNPIDFEFLELHNGKVLGQGDDVIGSFTVAGTYTIKNHKGVLKMEKKYLGKHTVFYNGNIVRKGDEYEVTGLWTINKLYGDFIMSLFPNIKIHQKNDSEANKFTSHKKKVMLSFANNQKNIAELVSKKLDKHGIQITYEIHDKHKMIKLAAKEARVVVPFMSLSYEESTELKQFLSYVDQVGIPIVPVKAQPHPYNQSGWLGVICAGALWTQLTNFEEIETRTINLIEQMQPYLKDAEDDQGHRSSVDVSGKATGYYVQNGKKFEMSFDMLAFIEGRIAGQGDDKTGSFVIHGEYNDDASDANGSSSFTFKKHYIGKHDVHYSGIMKKTETEYSLDGHWMINHLSDPFHIEVSRTQTSVPKGFHVMLSYQWNNQEIVKRVANILKERNIPIWFDIAGDMKGNINAAMANGVENAALVLSFNTTAYSKSVNCQKELTYATQLNKPILPVLLEDIKNFEDTWLGQIITSLNKIDLKNTDQFETMVDSFVKEIDSILKKEPIGIVQKSEVKTIFEGGSVKGLYYQYNKPHEMVFEFFRMSKGNVSGQGSDKTGHFTMAGIYDNDGNISFKKQYIGKHAVEYVGSFIKLTEGFEINGKWIIRDCLTDKFILKGSA
ncbi:uncharacterized protein LOC101241070 [Hydra vulgaris]|uniref:uncharacterized protein LOC101241070 n=1 Tax=Hydra vulgaris TaxID=6087 RepID=UPI001F5E9A57|nr:uncharacterized protein LOC101241070 [Hydra vulgaris]